MTDLDSSAAAPPLPTQIRVLAQFTRDLSFENPRAPDSLRAATQPQIELGVEMSARGRTDGLYEVDLKLSAAAVSEGQPAFQIEGVPEEHLEPVLLVECPRYLFPFARRIISDATADGGFPPFMLEPIDFASVYAAQRAGQEGLDQPAAGRA